MLSLCERLMSTLGFLAYILSSIRPEWPCCGVADTLSSIFHSLHPTAVRWPALNGSFQVFCGSTTSKSPLCLIISPQRWPRFRVWCLSRCSSRGVVLQNARTFFNMAEKNLIRLIFSNSRKSFTESGYSFERVIKYSGEIESEIDD